MRESEEDRSRLAAFFYSQRNRNNDSNENSSWQRDGEATQREGRRLGRNLTFYLPGESFVCLSVFLFFLLLMGLKEIISLSGDPFT